MANEFTITASLSCLKSSIMNTAVGRSITSLLRNMTGTTYTEGSMSVGTSATVIPLGNVTQPHWAWFANLDPTNYLTIFNGASGAVLLRLLPGDVALVPLDPTATPYAQANTNPTQMEYMIFAM